MFFDKILTLAPFAQAGADTNSGLLTMLVWMGPVLILFWFLFINPQRREEDRRKKMLDALKKGDKVYTVGGIIGVVYSVDREKKEITLSLDDNAKVKFLISAVAAVLSEESEGTKKLSTDKN